MIFGDTPAAPTLTQRVEAAGRKVLNVAEEAWDVSNWPEEDLAAVVGIDVAWVTGMVIALKMLGVGIYKMVTARRARRLSR